MLFGSKPKYLRIEVEKLSNTQIERWTHRDGSDDSGSPVLRSQRSQNKVSLSLPTISSSSESYESLKKFFQNLPKKKIRKKKRSFKVLSSSSSDEDLNFTPFVARKNRHQVGGHMTMACLTGKGHGKNKAAPKA